MARRFYRRRTVVVRPKKKWGSNMKQFQLGPVNVGTTQLSYAVADLAVNSAQTTTPTPTILKCGNFKVQGDCYISSQSQSALIEMMLYVLYLPEGVAPGDATAASTLVTAHPEWILSWKCIDMNTVGQQSVNAFSFSSRLKRNLNSGDKIVIMCVGRAGTTAAGNVSIYVHGNCQF